jgi:hypothetical protein
MTIETLDLGKETDIKGESIEDPDRIVRIHRGDEDIAGVVNRLEMPRRDVPRDAANGEVTRHRDSRFQPRDLARPLRSRKGATPPPAR